MEIRIPRETSEPLRLELGQAILDGDVALTKRATGVVVFGHGSGASRLSPASRYVARHLASRGFAVLLLDLLNVEEGVREPSRPVSAEALARRLVAAAEWLSRWPATHALPVGYLVTTSDHGQARAVARLLDGCALHVLPGAGPVHDDEAQESAAREAAQCLVRSMGLETQPTRPGAPASTPRADREPVSAGLRSPLAVPRTTAAG